jgi:hypothetical protein
MLLATLVGYLWAEAYAPLLVFLGSADEEVSPAICERVIPQNSQSRWIVYPGATHDFDDPDTSRQSEPV